MGEKVEASQKTLALNDRVKVIFDEVERGYYTDPKHFFEVMFELLDEADKELRKFDGLVAELRKLKVSRMDLCASKYAYKDCPIRKRWGCSGDGKVIGCAGEYYVSLKKVLVLLNVEAKSKMIMTKEEFKRMLSRLHRQVGQFKKRKRDRVEKI